jgi:hypothetical protein
LCYGFIPADSDNYVVAVAIIRRKAMSVENTLPALLPTAGMRIDGAPRALIRLPSDVSLHSAASAPARIGNLVRQAMKFFESNREAAWCCLKDASTLLGAEEVNRRTVLHHCKTPLDPAGSPCGRQSGLSLTLRLILERR